MLACQGGPTRAFIGTMASRSADGVRITGDCVGHNPPSESTPMRSASIRNSYRPAEKRELTEKGVWGSVYYVLEKPDTSPLE